MSERIAVMRGPISDVGLPQLLQVVALSRQFTSVEIRSSQSLVGAIFVKAGRVVRILPDATDARTTLRELLAEGADWQFEVYRLPDEAFPEPIGTLDELLMDAFVSMPEKPPAAPAPAKSPTQTQPPPSIPRPQRKLSPTPAMPMQAVASAPVVCVVSPKGGAGKTTISVHLAVAAARRGLRTVLVDIDPNGDVASSLGAGDRIQRGLYDLLHGTPVPDALRQTPIDTLRVLPSRGTETPMEVLGPDFDAARLEEVLGRLKARADLVVIDCPAGVFGATAAALGASTHALGVFQAEPLASRSFDMLRRALGQHTETKLLGVVVNMFSARSSESCQSLASLDEAGDKPFEVTLPRSDAFARASHQGRPVGDTEGASQLSWIFEGLADEVGRRLGILGDRPSTSGPFLM